MTTFAELQTLVEAQTRRPEIPAITQAAIRTATLRAHHTEFFERDLAIGTLSYTPASTATYYDLPAVSTSLLRLRTLQLVQGTDTAGAVLEELEYRANDDVYDSDNVRRPSIYTRIGDTLRVYPQVATGRLSLLFYQNPALTPSGSFSSWIADTHPDELAMWAAGIVFARTGFAEMAADVQKMHVQPFKELLLASYMLGGV